MSGRKKPSLRPLKWFSGTLILGTVLILALTALVKYRQSPGEFSPPLLTDTIPLTPETPPHTETPHTRPPALQCTKAADDPSHRQRINLLLIGQDTRESGTRARSDAMILCSLGPDNQTLTLISFLRDLYVQIPGHSPNRLNAAYALGGTELLKKTFSHNFQITVDGCIEVDFQQFVRLIDLMGGVTLSLRQDEANLLNQLSGCTTLSEGTQQLDGEQALAYARIRKLDSDGDFSRTLRQRKLLTALLEQLKKCSLKDTISLFASIGDLVSTDLTASQIAAYSVRFLPILSQVEMNQLRIPGDGTFTPKTIDGMDVLVADPQKTLAILQTVFDEQ